MWSYLAHCENAHIAHSSVQRYLYKSAMSIDFPMSEQTDHSDHFQYLQCRSPTHLLLHQRPRIVCLCFLNRLVSYSLRVQWFLPSMMPLADFYPVSRAFSTVPSLRLIAFPILQQRHNWDIADDHNSGYWRGDFSDIRSIVRVCCRKTPRTSGLQIAVTERLLCSQCQPTDTVSCRSVVVEPIFSSAGHSTVASLICYRFKSIVADDWLQPIDGPPSLNQSNPPRVGAKAGG